MQLLRGDDLSSPVNCKRSERFADQADQVLDPGDSLRREDGTGDHLAASVAEREQMAGEISAVDGRDVLGLERAQVAGRVPVVEMAAEELEAIHRGQRRVEALERFVRAGPSEVVRGNNR